MRERAAAVAVTERIHALDAGAQRVVDLDVTESVDFDSGFPETKIVGIRHATDRKQHVRGGG